MKHFSKFLAVILTVCLLQTGGIALADAPVTFLLPIEYFVVEEGQTASTQAQLDEHSVNGLKYEFTADGQILCTVTDQDAALKAVLRDMEETFAGAQDTANAMYAKSFRKLEHNTDLSEIIVTCSKADWGFMDSFYSMFFIANARDYQLYSGVPATQLKCEVRFVDENGNVLYSDNLAEYMTVDDPGEEPETTGPVEPSSTGDGKMPYDQVLRLIKWISDGYFNNKTYEEVVAFTGVEGLDKGHKDTSMTALGDHYFDWIADSDKTHYIHVCFRGRDESGRFEACQWNTSGFRSEEWANIDLTDWLVETACHETTETSLDIQRFSNPLVTVTAQMPVVGWNTRVSMNTAYFYNERGQRNNDPRIEVITYDDPSMFDFYLDKYENVQPAESRVIAGVQMKGRTYHTSGWDWTEYSAQMSEKVAIAVRISRVNCSAGTEGAALLDSLQLSWTEKDGTVWMFPGSEAIGAADTEPVIEVTLEPVPVVTETPAPVINAAPVMKDEFAPNDPIEFIEEVFDGPDSWTLYSFVNELNGIGIAFCMPMDAETTVSDFYASKDPTFQANTGKAYFHWRYDAAGKTKMSVDVSYLNLTSKQSEIKSLMGHNADGNVYTTLKTDRDFTIYRKVNNRGEYRWAIVSDALNDGSRVLALVEVANSGKAGEPWYEEIVKAFEGSVQLNIPGNLQMAEKTEAPVVTPVPVTPAPVTAAPATAIPATAAPQTAAPVITDELNGYTGVWYSTWLKAGGINDDPRKMFGMTIVLTLNADGTGDLDYFGSDGGGHWGKDDEGIVRYWGEGTPMSFLEDGTLCWGSYLSGYTLFSRDKDAEAKVFPKDPSEEIITLPVVTAAPQTDSDVKPAANGNCIGVKFVGKTYIAGGISMDAAMLGGEYSIVLNDDATATFTMAGMAVPGYNWKQAGDHIDVDAYGTVLMTLTMQADGTMLLDYSNSFQLVMEAQ